MKKNESRHLLTTDLLEMTTDYSKIEANMSDLLEHVKLDS